MPSRAIEAMSQALNDLSQYVPPAIYADVKRCWVAVERDYISLLAEQERLRAELRRG
jgi:hypothetical protein